MLRLVILLASAAASAAALPAAGSLAKWNTSSGDWSTGSNWTSTTVPDTQTNVYIMNNGVATLTTPGAVGLALKIGSSGFGGSLAALDGSLAITGDAEISRGVFTLDGAAVAIGRRFKVAGTPSTPASALLTSGTFSAGELFLTGLEGASRVTVDGAVVAVNRLSMYNKPTLGFVAHSGARLTVSGRALIAGTLDVDVGEADHGRFVLMTAGEFSGSFSTVRLPGAGWVWGISPAPSGSHEELWIERVPTPWSSITLAGAGALALKRRGRFTTC